MSTRIPLRTAAILITALAVLGTADAGAQQADRGSEIVGVALRAAADEAQRVGARTGPIALDPRARGTARASERVAWSRERPAEEALQVAGFVDARVASFDQVRICEGAGPRGCRLVEAEVFMAASDPVVEGNTAEVEVEVYFMTDSERQPVGVRHFVVTLVRDGGEWRVGELATVRAS